MPIHAFLVPRLSFDFFYSLEQWKTFIFRTLLFLVLPFSYLDFLLSTTHQPTFAMESVLHPSTLHFFTEIYPNKTIQSFFGHQTLDSSPQPQSERKQQRRQSAPVPIDNNFVPQQRYQRWSWTASSSVLPMETIQEEQED